MSIGINDFRAMMGKYNLGELVVKTDKSGAQSLAKINNARVFVDLRATANDAARNREVRQAFFASIESYLNSRDLGNRGRVFVEELRQDILGNNAQNKLTRQGDIARILDRVDHAVATGDFDAQAAGNLVASKSLTDRVVKKLGFSRDGWRQRALQGMISEAQNLLAPPQGQGLDAELVKLAAKRAGCSEQRVRTFLASRRATILDKATVQLPHIKFGQGGWAKEDFQRYASEHLKEFAMLGIAEAVRELHLETQQYSAIAKLSTEKQEVASFLLGTAAVPVADLVVKGELKGLLDALAALADGKSRTETTNIRGVAVAFRREGARLTATVGEATMYVTNPDELLERTMKAVGAAQAGVCTLDCAKGLFDPESTLLKADDNQTKRTARTAEVAKWVLSAKANLGEVELQGLSNTELIELADAVVKGIITVEGLKTQIKQASQKRMYSPEMLATIQRYGDIIDDVVTFGDKFNADAPKPDPVDALLADLICSENVWLHDEDPNKDGTRLRKMLLAHPDAVRQLMADDKATDGLKNRLPGGIDMSAPLEDLKGLLSNAGYKENEDLDNVVERLGAIGLSGIEQRIDGLVGTSMDKLQDEFVQLQGIGHARGEEVPHWMRSLDELVQDMKKSGGTKEGRFFAKVMGEYLKKAPLSEKRAMMASALRLAAADAKNDVKFGALLKGAGPVFQKILQGVSEGEIPPGLRGVFRDIKSNLAPIPKKAVNAILRQLVADSKGSITSIEVQDTLGSASVGQAFLCKVGLSDNTSVNCVVKMLKPDVQNRFARERPILETMAKAVDGNQEGLMFKRLEARLETIQDELNFRAESENLCAGDSAYNVKDGPHKSVSSNKILGGVNPEMNYLALELVEGDPVDKFLSQKIDGTVANILNGTDRKGSLYLSKNMDACIGRREELAKVLGDLGKCQEQLMELARVWFDTAVFGSGYFHGDLHAGNIMIGPKQDKVTIIDFGNAMKIGSDERKLLEKLVCDVAARDVDAFLNAYAEIVPADQKGDFAARKDGFVNSLRAIFDKGALDDTGTRLSIAMDLLEREGFSTSKSIYNFVQSQMRLQNAIEDVGLKIRQVKGIYDLQAPESPFDFRSEHYEVNWSTRLSKMFAPYYELLRMSVQGAGGTFDYDLTSKLPGGSVHDFNWDERRDEFLDCFMPSEERTADDVIAELNRTIQDHVVPLHRSLGAVKDEAGVSMNTRIDTLFQAWDEASRASLDEAKAAAKVLLDGLWEVQQDGAKGLARSTAPEIKNYGEAVQDVITERVNGMTILQKGAFLYNVTKDVCLKVLREGERQDEIRDRFSRLDTMRKCGNGGLPGLGDFVPGCIVNTEQWNAYCEAAKKFTFEPKVRQWLEQLDQMEENEKFTPERREDFAKNWLVNIKMLYKTALVVHNVPGIVACDQAVRDLVLDLNKASGKPENEYPYRIEDGMIKAEGKSSAFDDFIRKNVDGYARMKYEADSFAREPGGLAVLQNAGGYSLDDGLRASIAIFKAIYEPELFNGLGNADELLNELKAMKLDGKFPDVSLRLTEDELDELAQLAYDNQHPMRDECSHTLDFFKSQISESYARDVENMFKRSIDFIVEV